MGIKNVYDVAARAMSAQIVRMNTIASNLANANNVTSSEETAYKPMRPVFKTVYADQLKQSGLSTVCLLYTSPSPRDLSTARMPSSA